MTDENRRLKHIVAEQTLDIQALKAVVAANSTVYGRPARADLSPRHDGRVDSPREAFALIISSERLRGEAP